MKLVFLEPINVLSSREHQREIIKLNNNHNYDHFAEREYEAEKVLLLKDILKKTNSKMVLYTQDRCCSQKIGAMINKLVRLGLPDEYWYDTIPNGGNLYQDLLTWFSDKSNLNIENYVIIDSIKNGQTSQHAKNLFWADKDKGLTKEIANNIIDFLLNNK